MTVVMSAQWDKREVKAAAQKCNITMPVFKEKEKKK